jgi:hypothetical protein
MASNAQLAALDDVLGTRQHWLAHHMPDNGSQVHTATATQTQLKQNQPEDNKPSIICRDTCYKVQSRVPVEQKPSQHHTGRCLKWVQQPQQQQHAATSG